MNGVKGSNWFAREWLACALHNLRADTKNMPVRCRGREVRSSIGSLPLCQIAKRGCAEEDTIAFDKCQIRRDHRRRIGHEPANAWTSFVIQQPGEHRAGFRVENRQRLPRTASRSRAARPGLRVGGVAG